MNTSEHKRIEQEEIKNEKLPETIVMPEPSAMRKISQCKQLLDTQNY